MQRRNHIHRNIAKNKDVTKEHRQSGGLSHCKGRVAQKGDQPAWPGGRKLVDRGSHHATYTSLGLKPGAKPPCPYPQMSPDAPHRLRGPKGQETGPTNTSGPPSGNMK